ncbi:MAG: crossover junction endodeoxyribonuclease RuvC [Nitrospinae bacterium]|nr:crossover junction endodeoxyribonuclease RuvC [Nitrospinota bacterium]
MVLGVDPGTTHTGYGVITDVRGQLTALDWGVISPRPSLSLPDKLHTIHMALQACIELYHPDTMAVEALFFAKNVRSAVTLAHARGVALLTAATAGLAVAEYSPLEVKQAVVGYGRADKGQVQAMVRVLLSVCEPLPEEDAADALAVALCHMQGRRVRTTLASLLATRSRR